MFSENYDYLNYKAWVDPIKTEAFTGGVLKNLAIFKRKTPALESLFDKVAAIQACNFTKIRLQHRCFL